MIDLLEKYSITDIIIFLVFLALAAKELITFIEWSKSKIREAGLEATMDKREEEKLDGYDEAIRKNNSRIVNLEKELESLSEEVTKLKKILMSTQMRLKK